MRIQTNKTPQIEISFTHLAVILGAITVSNFVIGMGKKKFLPTELF